MPVPFVARAGVLAEVDSALAAARAGRGTLLTVTGEPGIGKTRLAEEAGGRAAGFEVVWTWCPAAAEGAALRPWSRVLRVLAGRHAAVARLIADSPFLAALADPARAEDRRDPEGARSQLSFDLAEVIAAAAAKRPVLVVIDDAHQSDVSSLRLLAELAPALRTMPAAVLVTARDGDRDWHGRLDMRTTLLRSGVVISPQPLAAGDIAAVMASLTGGPAGPGLVRVIAERSAGNPFLVTELARHLAGQGTGPAAARAIVPDSVRALAGARLAELTDTARDVLRSASVLGTRFRRDVLAGLAGVQPGELAGALAAGRDARLLDLAGPGEDRFRHDLVRDAIYDSIPVAAREDLHARAGDVLAWMAARGRDVDDAEVAYHLVRAGIAVAGQAAEYAGRAGEAALAALAFEDAVHWHERAAACLATLRAGDDEQACSALRLGAARLAAGDLDGGRAAFRQAAERARRTGRPDLLARAALGLGGGPAGFEVGLLDGEQISLLEEARSGLPDRHSALIALVTARLSIASTLVLPESRRLELATEAVHQARSAGDDAALAAALAASCDALAGRGFALAGHRAAAVAGARALGAALAARIEAEAVLVFGGDPGRSSPPEPAEPVPPVRAPGPDHVFRRDGEVWTLAYHGREVQMKDSKGLRDLYVLIARPGTAVAALDLAAAPASTGLAGAVAGPDVLHPPADTGEVIDARARAAYRQRLRELEEAAAEADAAADIERSARIAAERDALVGTLTGAYGLGGRVRRSGSAAERARTAVTARIKDAIRRIGRAHPDLGRHLARSVRTGTFCVYEPDQPVRWSL